VVVDDVDAWTRKLEAMGAPCLHEAMPPGAHVVFDITRELWEGSAPVDAEETAVAAE
jgi:hypothetical protein